MTWASICGSSVLSVSEGDDKLVKYPAIFQRSQALVVTKMDLLPYTNFDIWTASAATWAGWPRRPRCFPSRPCAGTACSSSPTGWPPGGRPRWDRQVPPAGRDLQRLRAVFCQPDPSAGRRQATPQVPPGRRDLHKLRSHPAGGLLDADMSLPAASGSDSCQSPTRRWAIRSAAWCRAWAFGRSSTMRPARNRCPVGCRIKAARS